MIGRCIAPCMDCADRVVGGHGQCIRYAGYRAQMDAMSRRRAETRRRDGGAVDEIRRVQHATRYWQRQKR